MKPYYLWNNWQVELTGRYERISNDGYGQLYEEKTGRVIYGSSFLVDRSKNVMDGVRYSDVEVDAEGSFNLSASVSENNEVLSITISYLRLHEEQWARSVIESVKLSSTVDSSGKD